MKVLKKSRKKPKAGDVFTFQVRDGEFMFGRVIKEETTIGQMDGVILLYIYKAVSTSKEDIPLLKKENLLVPPIITSDHLWECGYFETVSRRPLVEGDAYPRHCFVGQWPRVTYCYDDFSKGPTIPPERFEPCSSYGASTCLGVDIEISEALGIPQSEDYHAMKAENADAIARANTLDESDLQGFVDCLSLVLQVDGSRKLTDDDCFGAWSAAEFIAALKGDPTTNIEEDSVEWAANSDIVPDADLIELAQQGFKRARQHLEANLDPNDKAHCEKMAADWDELENKLRS